MHTFLNPLSCWKNTKENYPIKTNFQRNFEIVLEKYRQLFSYIIQVSEAKQRSLDQGMFEAGLAKPDDMLTMRFVARQS